jgi:hypothetical protein
MEATTVTPIVTPSTYVQSTDDKTLIIKGSILIAKVSSIFMEIVADFSITLIPSNCFTTEKKRIILSFQFLRKKIF